MTSLCIMIYLKTHLFLYECKLAWFIDRLAALSWFMSQAFFVLQNKDLL